MKTVALQPVRSSNIYAIGHDPETNTLHVQFGHSKDRRNPGRTYLYPDVSAAEHEALLKAPSIGKHFAAHIRTKAFTSA